ncbi:MAG: isoaspartyl peptidase/L-asparaginase family protein [Candidatus Bathyarchaeia archaeon]
MAHGGAGHTCSHRTNKVLKSAVSSGLALLLSKHSAVTAVERAVNVLEDSNLFNAGVGSLSQSDGKVRMDACIMDGKTLMAGAVAGIEKVRNPVSVARAVMERTQHTLMAGYPATMFAVEQGFPNSDVRGQTKNVSETVGSIALDIFGRIAAASSTGGLGKTVLPGRVGDSAVIGAGIYATPRAGAIVTGVGEAMIKTVLSKTACELVEGGLKPTLAARRCIRIVSKVPRGKGGIVVLDHKGNYGVAHNCRDMPWQVRSTTLGKTGRRKRPRISPALE